MILSMIRLTVLVGIMAACASGGSAPPSRTRAGFSDVITAEEMAAAQVHSAYEAVTRLRPQFLRVHGATSIQNANADQRPRVYIDGAPYGSVETLRRITLGGIKEIRYVNARDATTRWGTGHGTGVIEVIRGSE